MMFGKVLPANGSSTPLAASNSRTCPSRSIATRFSPDQATPSNACLRDTTVRQPPPLEGESPDLTGKFGDLPHGPTSLTSSLPLAQAIASLLPSACSAMPSTSPGTFQVSSTFPAAASITQILSPAPAA